MDESPRSSIAEQFAMLVPSDRSFGGGNDREPYRNALNMPCQLNIAPELNRDLFPLSMDQDNLHQEHPQPSGSRAQQSPPSVGEELDLVGGTFAVIESDPGQC